MLLPSTPRRQRASDRRAERSALMTVSGERTSRGEPERLPGERRPGLVDDVRGEPSGSGRPSGDV